MKKLSILILLLLNVALLSGCMLNEQRSGLMEAFVKAEYNTMNFMLDNNYKVDDLVYDEESVVLSYIINDQIEVEKRLKSQGEFIGTARYIVTIGCEDRSELYSEVANIMHYVIGNSLAIDNAKKLLEECNFDSNTELDDFININIKKDSGKVKITIIADSQ